MPELPDVTVYVERLNALVSGHSVRGVRVASPFLVRTVDPPIESLISATLLDVRRLGKQLVFSFSDDLFLVLHLMIAGRLLWKDAGARIPGKIGLAALDFDHASLVLTEASTKKRASIHVLRGESALAKFDRGGLDPLNSTREQFAEQLTRESHTLKRALTDPDLFSGIGNAYSDEIFHAARLSPIRLTRQLSDDEITSLFDATREVLTLWLDRLRKESASGFPTKVTAFRQEMAVHGKYGQPCPDCGASVQRIVYAENECDYCARCQTGGKLLADRSLSRLMRSDWPRTLDELERHRSERRARVAQDT